MIMNAATVSGFGPLFLGLAFLFSAGNVEGLTLNYKWAVNYQLGSPDCVEKVLVTVNGQFPGPAIRGQVGDFVRIELTNHLPTEVIVIHWHGIHQVGTPWFDGAAYVSQCPIIPGETFIYEFLLEKAGTFFYHGHIGLQRTEGFYGSLIVDVPQGEPKEPFEYNGGELSILLSDWWHKPAYRQTMDLLSTNFKWVGDPQSLLIEGRGHYNCSLIPAALKDTGDVAYCNMTNPQCQPHVLSVEPGKTYRLRIANVASISLINFAIEGHKVIVVEADSHYIVPLQLTNLDVYPGQSYSVLTTADQDPTNNYWATAKVRGRNSTTPTAYAIFNYLTNLASLTPVTLPPPAFIPLWNDHKYSMGQSQDYIALQGSSGPKVPLQADRQLVLVTTQHRINDMSIRWAINNVSLVLPVTPYLAAMKYNISNAYDSLTPAPDMYPPGFDMGKPMPLSYSPHFGSGVYTFPLNATIDVVLQNANTSSEIHPWHLHGHDFWVLGYGMGAFDPMIHMATLNLRNPPLRNTVPVFLYGWTVIRFRADNPGVWQLHCHVEPHSIMGMGVVFVEGIEKVGHIPSSTMGCGLTKTLLP